MDLHGAFVGCSELFDGCDVALFSALNGSGIQASTLNQPLSYGSGQSSASAGGSGGGEPLPTLHMAPGVTLEDFMRRPEAAFRVSCMQVGGQKWSAGIREACLRRQSACHRGGPNHSGLTIPLTGWLPRPKIRDGWVEVPAGVGESKGICLIAPPSPSFTQVSPSFLTPTLFHVSNLVFLLPALKSRPGGAPHALSSTRVCVECGNNGRPATSLQPH